MEHATETLRPNSAQESRFNIQRTSVFLRLEQVDDVERQCRLIVHCPTATQEHVLIGYIVRELGPRNQRRDGRVLERGDVRLERLGGRGLDNTRHAC